jgi:quaternary ammonium compound-resistance protein SugE
MSWILLVTAGLLEIAWVAGLRQSDGFTRLAPTLFTLVTAALSLALLGHAAKTLPLGTAYAVWTAIGVGGSVLFGVLILGESVGFGQALCLALILAGVVGLHLCGSHGAM